MRPIAALDCETDPFKHMRKVKPFIWGVYYNGEFAHFPKFGGALDWLKAQNEKIVVYAHNGGRFDFLFKEVLETIPSGTHLQLIHGRLAKFRIGQLEFRDSLSAVPIALAKYKKSEMAYWKLEKAHRKKYRKQIIDYLKSDVVNLHELMTEFVTTYGPSLTLAGSSQKAACKIEDIETAKSTYAYFKTLKKFYYGGRVQRFTKGKVKGPIRLWDINSAYPHAMLQNHPWGGTYHYDVYRGGAVPGPSAVEISAESHGAFPFGDRKNGTSFPDDGQRREFKVTGWEYNAAKRLGLLGKKPEITGIYKFQQTKNYKKYVNHFYNIRKAAPEGSAAKIFGKLFMNSYYGKQGQDGSAYEQYLLDTPKKMRALAADGWQLREELEDGRWIYFRPEPKERWRFYDVAIALSVTGFVRARILESIAEARRAGSQVHYVDTDGIQTTGPWAPPQSDDLGGWKLEGVVTTGYYAGKKLYALKMKDGTWKKAHKGAVLTGNQIVRLVEQGAVITYKKAAPSMGLLSGTKFIQRRIRAIK